MEKSVIATVDVGRLGEQQACEFLKKRGWKVMERNYRSRAGEIDLVARQGDVVIFVEVKTRCSTAYAEPWESVGHRKRNRLKAAARTYIGERSLYGNLEFRFDVISITLDDALKPKVEWIQSAF